MTTTEKDLLRHIFGFEWNSNGFGVSCPPSERLVMVNSREWKVAKRFEHLGIVTIKPAKFTDMFSVERKMK